MTRNKEAQAAMSARKLFYLGPQGTFTHQAAVNAAQELARLEPQGFDLMPMASHFNQANHSGKSVLARAARLFYSRRGRRTNIILYSLLFIIFIKELI